MTADFYQLGLEQAKRQEYGDAIASFTKAIAQNPYQANALTQRDSLTTMRVTCI